MDRKYAEFVAKQGPLFHKLKHMDRLNFEDTSLMNKWTTKVLKKVIEAMPIILEENELGDCIDPSEEEGFPVRKSSSIWQFVSQSEKNIDMTGNVTDIVLTSNYFTEHGFVTKYSTEFFPKKYSRNNKISSTLFFESSSDEEMDGSFKFGLSLQKKNIARKYCHRQSSKARTGSIGLSGKYSEISLPSTSLEKKVSKTSRSQSSAELLTRDFSYQKPSRRIARPLNLRYSSEKLDYESGKKLGRSTSFMNIFNKEEVETSVVPNMGSDFRRNTSIRGNNVDFPLPEHRREFHTLLGQKNTEKLDKKPKFQIPSVQPTTSKMHPTQFRKLYPNLQSMGDLILENKSKKESNKARLSFNYWWRHMDYNLYSQMQQFLDGEQERDSEED